MTLGLDYPSGNLLAPPLPAQEFASDYQNGLEQNQAELRAKTATGQAIARLHFDQPFAPTPDPADPQAVGWTFLINAQDPQRQELIEAIRPLAQWRGMADPTAPLSFTPDPGKPWAQWLDEQYAAQVIPRRPYYILILGGPDQVPFSFQVLINCGAAVGRLAFDSIADLQAYVRKLLAQEQATRSSVTRNTVFFAPDYGPNDPTSYSHRYLAVPLADRTRRAYGLPVQALFGDDATKARLLAAVQERPALVFAASHGIFAGGQPLAVQQRVNGAICCQKSTADWILLAENVPLDQPFLEHAILFQFACHGYGTPAQSDYNHWLNKPSFNAPTDFIAALPKRLLAHPRGPIAYIGHVDTAFLHGFDDPNHPELPVVQGWSDRITPFSDALYWLLNERHPAGHAMRKMADRYNSNNTWLLGVYNDLKRRHLLVTAGVEQQLADAFIFSRDAQNYMIFGDPAARLDIPTGQPNSGVQ